MMHFRQRTLIIDGVQAKNRDRKYTAWRRDGKRVKRYPKYCRTTNPNNQ